ncbi:MAG TPA: PHP domain-containing protein [Methanocorpusculum sp.]|nr:PHP domain-containing protein [Methanocorpusculum sp.]
MVLITCDLHIHTNASADGKCSVEDVIAKAKERGFQAIAITDHDTTKGAKQALAIKDPGIIIIPGIEVSTKQGHVLVLGTTKEYEPGKNTVETIREAKADGCLVIIPHPFHRWRHGVGLHAPNALLEADGIEVFNSRYYIGAANTRAAKFAKRYRKPMTAGSDAHTCRFVGYGINIIDADDSTVPAILDAIKKGKVESRCIKTPIRTYSSQSFQNVVRKARRKTSRLKPRRVR